MFTDMLSWICMLKSKHLFISSFIGFEIRKKEQAKWAKWARILKNNLTDEQLCSLICCLVFACLNIYQYICSFIAFEISKKSELSELKCSKSLNQMTSYAHWHAFLYLHAYIKTIFYLSYFKSEKKSKLNELNELEYLKSLNQTTSYAHWYVFLYLHAYIQTFIYPI